MAARPRGHGPRRLESLPARSETAGAPAPHRLPDSRALGRGRPPYPAGPRRVLRPEHTRRATGDSAFLRSHGPFRGDGRLRRANAGLPPRAMTELTGAPSAP